MNADLLAANITAHWVQSGVLAAVAIIAMRVMRLHEPRARLAALHLTVISIIALPLMQPMRVDEPASRAIATTQTKFFDTVAYEVAVGEDAATVTWLTPARAALVIALAGIVIRLAWLFYGIVTLARFSRAATDIPPPAAANDLEGALQLSPRYVQQTRSRGPWTFGCLRPTVALPADFDALTPEFQRAVICHELLHIKRRDIAVAFFEELAIAALWFHPWMWLLRARIRVTREQVVDSRVVAMLDNRDDYVRCLVDLSGHDLAPHFSQAGAGMLRPRELRARVDAIFQEVHMSRMRVAVAAVAFVAVTITTGFVAVAAMPLRGSSLASPSTSSELPMLMSRYFIGKGGATPIRSSIAARLQLAQSPTVPDVPRRQINKVYPEYPKDALERGIKGIVVVDVTVNAAGDVSTAAVASGPQELRASALTTALGLKFTPGSSVVAMKISLDYMLTVNSWGVRIWDSTADGTRPGPVVYSSRGPENPMPTAARVGGAVRPPRKIKDAPPVYPAEAQAARVQGVVILEARVDENGNVSHTHVLRSIPLLDQAATDAVKQWQYEPTLLNGSPIPVIMTVTVNFSLRERLEMRVVLPDGNSMNLDMPPVGMVKREFAGAGIYQLRSLRERESNDATVSVFTEDGQTHLGDVVVTVNGPVVQLPTTPSLGLQFIGIR